MTETATHADPPAAPAQRLHPMSWLFVLVAQLRQFIVPLLALLLLGRGGDGRELWPLLGVAALAASSAWQYLTYRYGVAADALVVRRGLLERNLRVIPFARIHNVAVQQSVLHRLFGVAEVRLESAGGKRPEAEMRVLRLDEALALEALVRTRGAAPAAGDAAEPAGERLLALDTGELLRLGLVSNRGLIVAGAAAGAASQASPQLLPNLFEAWGKALFGWAEARDFAGVDYALAGASLVVAVLLLLRVLSVVLALLQYHGFELRAQGRRLTVERGLFARWRSSAPRRRIQAWTLREGVLHRLLARRSLEVDTAVSGEARERALRELAPIATPARCDALVRRLLATADGQAPDWPDPGWQPLPARHWWRLWWPSLPLAAAVAAALAWRWGGWGLLALAWVPWAGFVARMHARHMAWAVDHRLVAVRGGCWSRWWRFAEVEKLQALQLRRSPLDRACGTASLWLDTAGASSLAPPLRIRFLPVERARQLQAQLAARLAGMPLRW